jgi:hypothetical protein
LLEGRVELCKMNSTYEYSFFDVFESPIMRWVRVNLLPAVLPRRSWKWLAYLSSNGCIAAGVTVAVAANLVMLPEISSCLHFNLALNLQLDRRVNSPTCTSRFSDKFELSIQRVTLHLGLLH